VAHELCNLLADRLDCARVAVGLADGLQVHVLAISHQVRFDRRLDRVSGIESAMEECADQAAPITLPVSEGQERRVAQVHAQLLRHHANSAICSIPLECNEKPVGVLTLIREGGKRFDADGVEVLQEMAGRLAPVLELKRRESRSGVSKTMQGIGSQLKKLIGVGHVRRKLVVAFALVVVAGLLFIQVDMKVTARSTIEGRMQQVVAAPFAGYLLGANARAGDRINEGQLLAQLDDRELLLEQEKLDSERDKQGREYQEALASRERAKVSVIRARIEQTEARLDLIRDKLERTSLRAPFSGTVVSGDLSRSLGAPVERGQPLFELVPDDGYRVNMQVDEFDVAMLETGQRASLRLAGLPSRPVNVEVTRVVPIADAAEGGSRFRVEGEILDPTEALRPGLQGVAKIVVGRDSLIKVWTRELVQRLQLWAWSIGF
jgi:RND family efflux transporter MFP subunit